MHETQDTTIRPATPDDAAVIATIYNEAVTTSTATFDLEPVTAQARAEWLAQHDETHPVLVAERGGQIVAWGSLSAVSDRGAWDAPVEILAEGLGFTCVGVMHEVGRKFDRWLDVVILEKRL